MYTYNIEKKAKNTYVFLIHIYTKTIITRYEKSFQKLLATLEVEGFRKGKVPKNIAEKHIQKEEVYKELIQSLIPEIYEEIVKKENRKPILSPKIELIRAKEGEDWQIKITVAEKPAVQLGDYKQIIKAIKAESEKSDIWTPGKDNSKKEVQDEKKKQKILNDILSSLLKETKCEIPDLILEEELNKRLTRLVDDVQKIGLSVESYLKSKNITHDALKKSYTREIEDTYKLEFILSEISEKENITVEKKEMDEFFAHINEPKEREMARKNAYFYATVLRKQKTIDFLLSL